MFHVLTRKSGQKLQPLKKGQQIACLKDTLANLKQWQENVSHSYKNVRFIMQKSMISHETVSVGKEGL